MATYRKKPTRRSVNRSDKRDDRFSDVSANDLRQSHYQTQPSRSRLSRREAERRYAAPDVDLPDYGDYDERYSRENVQARYGADLQKRRKRSRRLRIFVIVALLVALIGGGAAFAYVNGINFNLSKNLDKGLSNVLVKSNLTKEPFYMVLLGTDESMGRSADGSTDGTYRTDTIMLARIDPVEKKVTLISMPRDTQVDLDGYGTQKLNAAYAIGGASAAVREVSQISGVGISHFALVDMDGLKEVIDALGGIEVDVPIDINDPDAGGSLKAGVQTLTGDQALILCRARHAYDDFGAGDYYRAANQRLVLSAIMHKVLSSDVGTIASTVNSLSSAVSTDLNVSDIVGLAQTMQGMDTEADIYSARMPTMSVYEDDIWYERIDTANWKTMMDRVKQGLPPTESGEVDAATGTILSSVGDAGSQTVNNTNIDKSGSVYVRNGSGVTGVAQTAASKLSAAGYQVSDIGNADDFSYNDTLVIYNDDTRKAAAEDMARILGNGAKAHKNNNEYLFESDYLVVIGSSWVAQ